VSSIRKEASCSVEDILEASGVLIRIQIDNTHPLTGIAATKGRDPLHFDGWLELLRVISDLVGAETSSGSGDVETADQPTHRRGDQYQ
jgi:hypothetical protein